MENNDFGVDQAACRQRQRRLLAAMEQRGLELVLVLRDESVQWLTGARVGPLFASAVVLDVEGKVTLVLPSRKLSLSVAADEVVPYEEKWHSTLLDEQRAACHESLLAALPVRPQRVGGEWSALGPRLLAQFGGDIGNGDFENSIIENIEPLLFELRRRKDPDELRKMQRANEANRAMYEHARQVIEPGINELELYSSLHAVAVRELGEALTYFGQDFRCNARGGLPRDRQAQAGELFILDLGVGFRGYYSDNARTIAVGGAPTKVQQLAEVFPLVESEVRPGASCKALFEQVQALLDQNRPWVFNHHLGHGVGLAPHEGPHLNPRWDDHFEVGDYIAVEPGLYHEELRCGIRLEENYRVTDRGVERLTDYPLEL